MKSSYQKELVQLSVRVPEGVESALLDEMNDCFALGASGYFCERTRSTKISVYLIPDDSVKERSAQFCEVINRFKSDGLLPRATRVYQKTLPPQDWAESWKKHFKAFKVFRTFFIKPSWIRKKNADGIQEIVIDPGLSFGTGHHPTTRFCLEEIARSKNALIHGSMLDLGTGSGILAIAGAKLGCQSIRAIDSDPISIEVAEANASANKVSHNIEFRTASVFKLPGQPKRKYTVVCANILASVLVDAASLISAQVEGRGLLIVAGILTPQFSEVRRAFESHGMRWKKSKKVKEWTSGAFVRD